MKLKIKITQEVLEATKYCGTSPLQSTVFNCAIAYACRQLFPKCMVGIRKDIYGIYYVNPDRKIANLPDEAIDFIKEFDKATPEERVKMKPFEFEITLTDEALDLITIDEVTKVLEESTTLEVV